MEQMTQEELKQLEALMEKASRLLGEPDDVRCKNGELWGVTTYIQDGVCYKHTVENPKPHDPQQFC